MKTKNYMVVLWVVVLLAQLVFTTPVLADDSTPPPAPTEEAVTPLPPTEEPVVEATTTPEPAATETPVEESASAEPVMTETPAEATTSPEPPATETSTLQDLPADTSLVVLSENGEVLPLATQEAAEVVAVADPIWCPVGVSPTPGANGCTSSFSSLSALVAGFVPTASGTIWIQNVPDTGSAVIINGSGNWATAKNYNLTLQGGWDLSSSGNISGTSTFSVPISITNWVGTVNVNDITVIGATGDGLKVQTTTGDINIHNITANYNSSRGVYLKSTSGNISMTGKNEISNNKGTGMDIQTSGAGNIVLQNMTVNNNGWWGALIMNSSVTGTVTLEGTNQFSNNYRRGLGIYSNGDIVVYNLTANNNGWGKDHLDFAAELNNRNVGSTGDIAVYGDNQFLGNAGGGLVIRTNGDVIISKSATFIGSPVYIAGAKSITEIQYAPTVSTTMQQSGTQVEFDLSCTTRGNYFATLPNEDKIQIVCPVSGKAIIKRLNNTALPGDLPVGYTYTSAFSLDILQSGKSISHISEGGRVNVSFDVPFIQPGITYTLLYWDNGTWIPLKDYMIDENGNPRQFNLHPDDPRMVLSGLKLVFEDGEPRLELSTNFPGIFVLVQR
jgi:hypothetical protein